VFPLSAKAFLLQSGWFGVVRAGNDQTLCLIAIWLWEKRLVAVGSVVWMDDGLAVVRRITYLLIN